MKGYRIKENKINRNYSREMTSQTVRTGNEDGTVKNRIIRVYNLVRTSR